MNRATDKKTKANDPARGEMSDTLSEASLAYQKRVKAGKLATKSVAPNFATDSRNFDHRGLQKPVTEKRTTPPRDKLSPSRQRFASEDKPPLHGVSKSNSGRERAVSNGRERSTTSPAPLYSSSRQRVSSRDGVTSTSKDRPPSHPPSGRPPLKKTLSRSKGVSSDRTSTPALEHNVDRLLINIKLMKESLRDFLNVDEELGIVMSDQDPSDDPAVYEALWVVKRGVEELAVAKARLQTLEALLRDGKVMQHELTREVEELSVARSERDHTIADLKHKISDTVSDDAPTAQVPQGFTQKDIDEAVAAAVAVAVAAERKTSSEEREVSKNASDSLEGIDATAHHSASAKKEAETMQSLCEKTDKLLKDKAVKRALKEEREATIKWVAAVIESERVSNAEHMSAAKKLSLDAEKALKLQLEKQAEMEANKFELSRVTSPPPPPEPSTPESVKSARSSEGGLYSANHSNAQSSNPVLSNVWQSMLLYCQSKGASLVKVWSSDFDRSQTGKNTLAQFSRGLERCGVRLKGNEAEEVFDDMVKRTKKSTISVEDLLMACELSLPVLNDSERLALGLPIRDQEVKDLLEHSEKTSPHKAGTRKARHSLPGTSSTTPTSRSKSPKSRSMNRADTLQRRKTIKETTVDQPFDLADELSKIVGQSKLKEQLLAFEKGIELQARRKELGIECSEQQPPHMMFCGNPGTGKTTIARLVGLVLKKLGVLKKGHLVEVQRSDLVAGAIGQTALKTREKINEARGGVLFVDEAYTLAPLGSAETKDFGREAINEIMSVMNDGDPVVIFAGYKKEMETFVHANAGLFRRIDVRYDFEDYSTLELALILRKEVTSSGFHLHSSIADEVVSSLLAAHTDMTLRSAMGGGLSRQLFRKARGKLDAELSLDASAQEMCTLTIQHLTAALVDISENLAPV